jgi:hypothetical protein
MANDDIRSYSMADLKAMRERGEIHTALMAGFYAVILGIEGGPVCRSS